jgi:hypothetical protein
LYGDSDIDLRKVCRIGVTEDAPEGGDYDPFGNETE